MIAAKSKRSRSKVYPCWVRSNQARSGRLSACRKTPHQALKRISTRLRAVSRLADGRKENENYSFAFTLLCVLPSSYDGANPLRRGHDGSRIREPGSADRHDRGAPRTTRASAGRFASSEGPGTNAGDRS